jgi:hypothetical protein
MTLPQPVQEKYDRTLDISCIPDLDKLEPKPTIFTVKPLDATTEKLLQSPTVDYWEIFKTHVEAVENFKEQDEDGELTTVKFKFKHGQMLDEYEEYFPIDIKRNIVDIIYTLSRSQSDLVFFSPPADLPGYRRNAIVSKIVNAAYNAHMGDATSSEPSTEASTGKSTEETQ